jgi:hypothetical protein
VSAEGRALIEPEKTILKEEYESHRRALSSSVAKAEAASRAILPLAGAEILISLGAGAYLPGAIRSAPAYPYIDLGLSIFGVLVLGFYALSAAELMVYNYVRLAQLDMRLGYGVRGYYLRDLVDHATVWKGATRREQSAARVACWVVGVKIRSSFVLSMAAIIVWTAIAGEGIALAYLYVHPTLLSLVSALLAGPLVFALLIAASRVVLSGGLPPSLKKMLASSEWMAAYRTSLAEEASRLPPDIRLEPTESNS